MNALNTSSTTLVELNTSTSHCVVFCTHTVGGGISGYKALAARLDDTAKIYGLEDPFIYADEEFSSVPELASLHVETIREVQPHGPYMLFGTCSGGPIAYEVAYQLSQQGEDIERLILFGSHDLGGFDPSIKGRYRFLQEYLGVRFKLNMDHFDWDAFEGMSRSDVCTTILQDIAARDEAWRHADRDWAKKSLESLCMTNAATKRYRVPKSRLNIDLYRQPRSARPADAQEDWCDWNDLSCGTVNIIPHEEGLVAGNDILSSPQVEKLAELLKLTSMKAYATCNTD